MAKQIQLTQGKVALVNDEDFEYLNQWKWSATSQPGWYAMRQVKRGGVRKTILMHRLILNAQAGQFVDHRDGNGLNNLRSNLRLCSFTENNRNRKAWKRNTTGFKGVTWEASRQKYKAAIKVGKKSIHLGRFSNAADAARAYDAAARQYHGEFANTNF